jgi:peptide deformylase
MSILPILTIPNHLLKEISIPIKKIDVETKTLIENIKKTLYFHNRCVGMLRFKLEY